MKPLVTLTIATTLAAISATGLGAQTSPPAQRAAVDVKMDAVPTLDVEGIRKIQTALQKRGVDPGPIDGILGPLTKESIRTFQGRYGMKPTGEVDNQTLFALGEVDLAS
jgi:peptidoglycan hydrolase-like protein with peptidoglycan-binding domain